MSQLVDLKPVDFRHLKIHVTHKPTKCPGFYAESPGPKVDTVSTPALFLRSSKAE